MSGTQRLSTASYSNARAGEITGRQRRSSSVCSKWYEAPRLDRKAATRMFVSSTTSSIVALSATAMPQSKLPAVGPKYGTKCGWEQELPAFRQSFHDVAARENLFAHFPTGTPSDRTVFPQHTSKAFARSCHWVRSCSMKLTTPASGEIHRRRRPNWLMAFTSFRGPLALVV